MRTGKSLTSVRPTLLIALLALTAAAAEAFPPYRSTDAETADPWTIEGRLGALRFRRDEGENTYVTPLLRLNLGLPHRLELVSELEHEAKAP